MGGCVDGDTIIHIVYLDDPWWLCCRVSFPLLILSFGLVCSCRGCASHFSCRSYTSPLRNKNVRLCFIAHSLRQRSVTEYILVMERYKSQGKEPG